MILIKISKVIAIFLCVISYGQNTECSMEPPPNPYLADSPWPIFHKNTYNQASSCQSGPQEGDEIRVRYKSGLTGATSPWIYLTEKYGKDRAILYSNSVLVYKLVDTGTDIVVADSLRIDFDLFDFGWNFLLAPGKIWFTYDPKSNPNDGATLLYKLTDKDTADIFSEIAVLDTLNFSDHGIGRVQTYTLSYTGEIIFNSENDENLGYAITGILDLDLNILDTLRYSTVPNEIVRHNSPAVDETNAYYIVTTHRLIKFQWDGKQVNHEWDAWYDFVGDGPTGKLAKGSGTSPTLMGWGEGNDQLIVVSDGHAENNLVAFWRTLPENWSGIEGMDKRVADVIRIPLAKSFSNTFQSIENSPCVFGYDLAVAQFNGFLGYDCDNIKGVQKIRWNQESNQWQVAWTNDEVNMNGVLTYSSGANLVYSSGKESDCIYYYYGLDWETGEVKLKIPLGEEGPSLSDDPFYDAGNNSILDDDGNIYFSGVGSLVKLEVEESQPASLKKRMPEITIHPNPAQNMIFISNLNIKDYEISLYGIDGKRYTVNKIEKGSISIEHLKEGLYVISFLDVSGKSNMVRFQIKR